MTMRSVFRSDPSIHKNEKGLSNLDEDAVFFARQAYTDTSRAKKRREKNHNPQPMILY